MRSNQHFSYNDFTAPEPTTPHKSNLIFMIVFAVDICTLQRVCRTRVLEHNCRGVSGLCDLGRVACVVLVRAALAGQVGQRWYELLSKEALWAAGADPRQSHSIRLPLLQLEVQVELPHQGLQPGLWVCAAGSELQVHLRQYIFLLEDQEDSRQEDAQINYSSLASLKFSFIGHIACYFVAFYFAFLFSDEYQKALQSCSLIAALISIPVPFFYYLKNRENLKRQFVEVTGSPKVSYTNLNVQNHLQLQEDETEAIKEISITVKTKAPLQVIRGYLPVASSFFIQSSLAVNLSYSTLWIMDGLIKKNIKQGAAFSLSIMYGSLFFCLSTLLYLASGYLLYYLSSKVKTIGCIFSLCYSLLLFKSYHLFDVGTVCAVILCTGLQLSIANFYETSLEQEDVMPNVVILAEFVVFCVVPFFIEFGLGSQDVGIYMAVSGVCSLLSAGCMALG